MESKAQSVIAYANQFGPLTTKNLCELTGMHPVSLRRVLPKLVAERRLYYVSQGMHKPYVYAAYDIRQRADFAHDLIRADVATAIEKTGLLSYWYQSRQKLPAYKEVNEDGRFDLSVEFQDKIGTLHFYLEVDIGSESYAQIENKITRYLARAQGETFQVLFVFKYDPAKKHRTSPATFAQLVQKYIRKADRQMWDTFLFCDYAQFLSDPIGKVCHIAYDPNRYSILSALAD